uniref:Titin n=1 Tax=Pygocentrus nattereri TaxID=42514 RepID=A0AAR2K1H9_PYGNA
MTGKWIRVNKTPVLDVRYRVSGLFEGNSYEFRIFAENIAGISEPSYPSDPIRATRPVTPPGPPSNLKLKDWSKSYADLVWTKPSRDGGSPVLGYVVECQKSGSAKWDRINKDLIKPCAFRVPGLIEGTEYRFRIRASNKAGDGEPRELAEAVLAKDILVPPEVTVDTFVFLKWKKPDYDGGSRNLAYHVEKKPKEAEEWERLHKGAIKETYFMADRCIENQIYQFRVQTKNEGGESNWVTTAEVLVKEELVVPEIKVNNVRLKIPIIGKPAPTVSWKKGDDENLTDTGRVCVESTAVNTTLLIRDCQRSDASKYTITLRNSAGSKESSIFVRVVGKPGICTGPINAPSEQTDTLVCTDEYGKPTPTSAWSKGGKYFKPSDICQIETTPTSSTLSIKYATRKDAGEYTITASNPFGVKEENVKVKVLDVPGPPGPIEASGISSEKVTLTWTPPHEDGGSAINTTLVNKDSIRKDGGEFVLTATNVGGFAKHVFNVKVLDRPGPPGGPLKVSDITAEKCVLTWAPPADDGGANIEYYVVEKRESSRLAWTNVVTNLQVTQYQVTKLLKGNEYIFRVMAVNKYGVGDPLESDPTVSDNPYVPPDPPQTPEITAITKDSMVICWGAPVHDGGSEITNYGIERRDRISLRWVKCNKKKVTDLHFKVTGLVPGHEYEFRVVAENAAGVSAPSPSSPFTKAIDTLFKPGPPGNPRILDTTSSSITLAWNKPVYDGGSEITGYIVETFSLEWDPPLNDGGTKIKNYVVEKREATRKAYATVNAICHKTEWTVDQLQEGCNYYFRVLAENEYGIGLPIETGESVKVSEKPLPPGKITLQDVTKTSVTLTWEKPEHDGGS